MKKPTGSFRFYKPETEKTEPKLKKIGKKPSQIRKKTKKTESNRKNRVKPFLSYKTEPKPVSLNRFRFGFEFFLKKFSLVTFLYKNQTELKMITPINNPP